MEKSVRLLKPPNAFAGLRKRKSLPMHQSYLLQGSGDLFPSTRHYVFTLCYPGDPKSCDEVPSNGSCCCPKLYATLLDYSSLQCLWTQCWYFRKDNHMTGLQQTPAPPTPYYTTIENTYINNVLMAQDYCDDEEENFRVFTLAELEGWATLLKEYRNEKYKHLTPYFEQAQKILKTILALMSSQTST
jgi:hypothetical protein